MTIASPDCRVALLFAIKREWGLIRVPAGSALAVPCTASVVIALSCESVRCASMGGDSMSEESPERRFRTLFISDVHLGARGSQATQWLDCPTGHDADPIYLVGDTVDGWALPPNWYAAQFH